MAASSASVLKLYKNMLRESQKFDSYNFRLYALRRIRDAFRENKSLSDQSKILELVKKAEENIEMIKRQAVVGSLYATEKLVIEKKAEKELAAKLGKS